MLGRPCRIQCGGNLCHCLRFVHAVNTGAARWRRNHIHVVFKRTGVASEQLAVSARTAWVSCLFKGAGTLLLVIDCIRCLCSRRDSASKTSQENGPLD